MKTAKDRFHEVMDSLGLNDYKVYTGIENISKNMMYKLRQGQTEEVSVKILMPFCEAYPPGQRQLHPHRQRSNVP